MNPRWREIAVKCWDNRTDGLHFDQEMCAELIIKECLTQVDKVDAMLEDNKEKTGVAWVALAIVKHFGIKDEV